MTVIAQRLDRRLHAWAPEKAHVVKRMIEEIIRMADADALDLLRTRQAEQEVLDILDAKPKTR